MAFKLGHLLVIARNLLGFRGGRCTPMIRLRKPMLYPLSYGSMTCYSRTFRNDFLSQNDHCTTLTHSCTTSFFPPPLFKHEKLRDGAKRCIEDVLLDTSNNTGWALCARNSRIVEFNRGARLGVRPRIEELDSHRPRSDVTTNQ
jgi:hypothetical protein